MPDFNVRRLVHGFKEFNLKTIVNSIGNMSDLIWSIGYDYKITTINTSPPITDDDATSVMIS